MQFLYHLAARFITKRPALVDALIARAKRTPYSNILGPDGSLYMERYWLFNPYGQDAEGHTTPARFSWLPSIRIHRIVRPDNDRHLHDHPWNARTIVLRGWYAEERPREALSDKQLASIDGFTLVGRELRGVFHRAAGYTGRLLFGQYHRISGISEGGVWTLFFTWRWRGTWGFNVNGQKVLWREYLEVKEACELVNKGSK